MPFWLKAKMRLHIFQHIMSIDKVLIIQHLELFPPFTNEHIPVIVTPVHMARFNTFRLRNSLMALENGAKLIC